MTTLTDRITQAIDAHDAETERKRAAAAAPNAVRLGFDGLIGDWCANRDAMSTWGRDVVVRHPLLPPSRTASGWRCGCGWWGPDCPDVLAAARAFGVSDDE